MIERLRGHLPKRTWEAAMQAARAAEGDGDRALNGRVGAVLHGNAADDYAAGPG